MVTNQMMSVQIGKDHTVKIGHLTQMGKLNDILEVGNSYRKSKGLRAVELREWLNKESTWEFIIEVERKYGDKFQTPESGVCISDYKNRHSKLDYSKLIKEFSVIKSQRGGKPENRGVWSNIFILLDLASYLSPVLKLEMYEIFITHKLLEWRDIGGDNFKEFNKVIDTLPDRVGKNNRSKYIEMSKVFRKKLDILDTKGYNEKEHNAFIQQKRAEWLDKLTFSINLGFVQNYEQLKNTVEKL